MSAIVGLWHRAADRDPAERCRDMLGALAAYGPERPACWAAGRVAIGRGLFTTLPEDRFDGQPLVSANGRFVLVCDARLDNREDLLTRLSLPEASWQETADSDLFLRVFERWGEDSFEMLAGDFAAAIWDRTAGSFILVRDPIGQRPLFYHQSAALFAFASLPRGLHALPEIPRAPDETALAGYLGLLPERGRSSYYAGVEALLPGHLLKVGESGLELKQFWRPRIEPLRLKTFGDYRDAFRSELEQAVWARLRRANGGVAAHLSAGWDSSSVAATAAMLSRGDGGKIQTFTARPEATSRMLPILGCLPDEGPLAAKTAAMHANIDPCEIEVSGHSLVEGMDRYVELFDRPVYGLPNQLWLSHIRRAVAARGNCVLLTGELGNFTVSSAPYTLLADYVRLRRWGDWFRESRRIAVSGDARLRGIAATSFGPWVPGPLWKAVRRFSSRPEVSAFSALHPSRAREMERTREALGIGLASRSKDYVKRTLRAINFYDTGLYRAGANAGWHVDERDPTSDLRLIKFCLSLPLDMLLKDGVRRPLARAALSDRLPPEVLDEKRKGYQAADWYLGVRRDLPAIRDLLEEIAANPLAASLLDLNTLRRWVAEAPSGGWEKPHVSARYRDGLLNALTAGHFILHASR